MTWAQNRQSELTMILERLLNSTEYRFDSTLRSVLPEAPGVYAISIIGQEEGIYIRAGRTDASLRQRIYGNHYMGNQSGNLRQQLVREGVVDDMSLTKKWINENCKVQFLVIADDNTRLTSEYFILSILKPKYCG